MCWNRICLLVIELHETAKDMIFYTTQKWTWTFPSKNSIVHRNSQKLLFDLCKFIALCGCDLISHKFPRYFQVIVYTVYILTYYCDLLFINDGKQHHFSKKKFFFHFSSIIRMNMNMNSETFMCQSVVWINHLKYTLTHHTLLEELEGKNTNLFFSTVTK